MCQFCDDFKQLCYRYIYFDCNELTFANQFNTKYKKILDRFTSTSNYEIIDSDSKLSELYSTSSVLKLLLHDKPLYNRKKLKVIEEIIDEIKEIKLKPRYYSVLTE
jgi:hypothetical protein